MEPLINGGIFMSKPIVPVRKLREGATLPKYGSAEAAGADLYACLDTSHVIFAPHETIMIPTGIAMGIPAGYVGLIYARSGIACKRGLAPANKVGVIDSDYRGEIMVALHNHAGEPRQIDNGERIAQMVVTPYLSVQFEQVDALTDTARGDGGFGSTGER